MSMKENPFTSRSKEAFPEVLDHRFDILVGEVQRVRDSLEEFFGPEVVVGDDARREEVRKRILAEQIAKTVPYTPETLAHDRLVEFDVHPEQSRLSLSSSGLVEMSSDPFPVIHESQQPPLSQTN
ncbi:MAG: hypothetical protein ABWX94_00155, partial [Candidatus Saccharimonadales bacterium]